MINSYKNFKFKGLATWFTDNGVPNLFIFVFIVKNWCWCNLHTFSNAKGWTQDNTFLQHWCGGVDPCSNGAPSSIFGMSWSGVCDSEQIIQHLTHVFKY